MTMARAAVQALASPIGGFAGNRYNRAEVVAVGCILWSIMTAFIGISSSLLMVRCLCLNP